MIVIELSNNPQESDLTKTCVSARTTATLRRDQYTLLADETRALAIIDLCHGSIKHSDLLGMFM